MPKVNKYEGELIKARRTAILAGYLARSAARSAAYSAVYAAEVFTTSAAHSAASAVISAGYIVEKGYSKELSFQIDLVMRLL